MKQIEDIMTKPLKHDQFVKLRDLLGVCTDPNLNHGSKNRPSPIRLGRVVTASLLTASSPILDTRLSSESV